ncbi:XdhC family protein [Agrobacterium vaccinii]|uniref:XdhC family protein n=1 Tax=Agrobacterium vaccinii TaxID=2735528 RepID=UPI002410E40B|nr:XdhC family protein [Agrobacterium vaccinii]UHS58323.1 XdhC family protein [Agrobacterium vaccinii]
MTETANLSLHNEVDVRQFHVFGAGTSPEMPAPEKAFSTDNALDVLNFAIESMMSGHKAALCTLVEIRGGSSRPLGAQMAVADDGRYCGYVSGGCTEAAIAAEALQAMVKGHDRFVMLGEGSPFFDIVLPCGGGITVAVHLVRDVTPLCSVVALVKNRQTGWLSYAPHSQRLSLGSVIGKAGWNDDIFITSYRPAVRVLLSGRSLEVETAAHVAKAAGYDVVIHDLGTVGAFDLSLIDDDTAVALLQHDLDLEMHTLEAALKSRPFYIGALGSARTHQKRVERLRQSGHSNEAIARIKAPIGLFEKARDAQTLALSVIADIAACRQSDLASG